MLLPQVMRCGSSPRRRGTLCLVCLFKLDQRFIPAQAGNTTSRGASSFSKPVHPRAGGEHQTFGVTQQVIDGSSPRRRGTRHRYSFKRIGNRFIPAQAGNTRCAVDFEVPNSVHPRAGGEHYGRRSLGRDRAGSSPRRRGTRHRVEPAVHPDRFIPAQAGNTRRAARRICFWSVHPRAGGEHREVALRRSIGGGSSPRRRGTLADAAEPDLPERFIPAQAGNTRPG